MCLSDTLGEIMDGNLEQSTDNFINKYTAISFDLLIDCCKMLGYSNSSVFFSVVIKGARSES